MLDWIILGVSVLVAAGALYGHHRFVFPPDPPRWRAPGLSMAVRNGRIHFRSIAR